MSNLIKSVQADITRGVVHVDLNINELENMTSAIDFVNELREMAYKAIDEDREFINSAVLDMDFDYF